MRGSIAAFVVLWVFCALLGLAFWAGIGWVAWHFLSKYW